MSRSPNVRRRRVRIALPPRAQKRRRRGPAGRRSRLPPARRRKRQPADHHPASVPLPLRVRLGSHGARARAEEPSRTARGMSRSPNVRRRRVRVVLSPRAFWLSPVKPTQPSHTAHETGCLPDVRRRRMRVSLFRRVPAGRRSRLPPARRRKRQPADHHPASVPLPLRVRLGSHGARARAEEPSRTARGMSRSPNVRRRRVRVVLSPRAFWLSPMKPTQPSHTAHETGMSRVLAEGCVSPSMPRARETPPCRRRVSVKERLQILLHASAEE